MFISVEAVKWVMNESVSERSARLVFVALAAHCNDDGYAWPSIETLCQYSKLSKPVVLEAIQKLAELKEIAIEKGGRGPRDTNHYYLSAFMDVRVRKGKENLDKGKVSPEKGSTRVDTNKNEQELLEEGSLSPEQEKRRQDAMDRAVDWHCRNWKTDDDGKRYLVSPSTGKRMYEGTFP
jgi:hypothetical protein